MKPKRIGLTGGIGVGKSCVGRLFGELYGIPCVDADQIAREVRAPGTPGALAIEKRFGTLDRAELRKIISSDPEAKQDLERILHPLIQIQSDAALEETAKRNPNAPFILYEASLLIEAGRAKDFDAVIVVTSPVHDRISRVQARDGVSEAQARLLIQAQSSDDYRLKHAHYEIKNNGSLEDLKKETLKVLDQIISS